jgi:hypothetical protein
MAMSRLLAMNLGKAKKQQAKVISEYAGKAAPVSKKPRSGATNRRRKGKKESGS